MILIAKQFNIICFKVIWIFVHHPINKNKYKVMYAGNISSLNNALWNWDYKFLILTWYLYSLLIKDLLTCSIYCFAPFRIQFSRSWNSYCCHYGFLHILDTIRLIIFLMISKINYFWVTHSFHLRFDIVHSMTHIILRTIFKSHFSDR